MPQILQQFKNNLVGFLSTKFSPSAINFNIVYDDFSEMESKSNGTNTDLEKSGQSRNPSETLWYHRV